MGAVSVLWPKCFQTEPDSSQASSPKFVWAAEQSRALAQLATSGGEEQMCPKGLPVELSVPPKSEKRTERQHPNQAASSLLAGA